MLIEGIVIVILVVAGVSIMFAVLQENAQVIETGVAIDNHSNERIREEIILTSENSTDLQLHNKGQDATVLEYRVMDDDGAILKTCRADQDVGASGTSVIAPNECWMEFVTP